MWFLGKIDEIIRWVKRCVQNTQYKKMTEKMIFGVYWKYQWRRGRSYSGSREIAIPYCPTSRCRVELVKGENENFFCPECKTEYVPRDAAGTISINEAQSRATNIFKSKL